MAQPAREISTLAVARCVGAGLAKVWLERGTSTHTGSSTILPIHTRPLTPCCRLPLDDPDRFRVEVLFRWAGRVEEVGADSTGCM